MWYYEIDHYRHKLKTNLPTPFERYQHAVPKMLGTMMVSIRGKGIVALSCLHKLESRLRDGYQAECALKYPLSLVGKGLLGLMWYE